MIEIKGLFKRYKDNILLEDYNLKINDGEFVVFAGKSGRGKTTLLNMIGGLEEPDKGEILVDGSCIFQRKNRTNYFTYQVGFLFQNFALLEEKSVRKNIEIVQKKARSGYTVEEVLQKVGLENKVDVPVYQLSGGEQQRVALARLMFKKCKYILADEPTGSLDGENASNVLRILHEMNEMGKTVILVTHSRDIIETEKRVILL